MNDLLDFNSIGSYRPFNFANGAQGSAAFGGAPNASFASPAMLDNAQRNTMDLSISNGNNFGFNLPTLQLGMQGLGALGSLYTGYKSLGLAQDQFDFNKKMATTNLNNSVTAYNTGLEDRLRTRAQFGGQPADSWKSDFERLKATR